MRVDFPSFSSDFRPRCLISAITLTLSFLWSCLYFSPIQTLQYMSSSFFLTLTLTLTPTPTPTLTLTLAPCSDPRLWNAYISFDGNTALANLLCFFFLMLNCFLLFLQNNSIILSFPFLVISFSHGLPPVSEYHFLPIL